MRYIKQTMLCACAVTLLSSCGSFDGKQGSSKSVTQTPVAADAPMTGVSDFPVKIGATYQVGNVSYTPVDAPAYDEVGYASWYGSELQGQNTANGEVFMASAVSAAHKTLPMPSYVEVTSLETGRTILARVNDRGPFANDRLIDLSEGAAKQLGITGQGVAGVRVRKVNPPEQDRAVLRSGQSAPVRMDTPESLLKVLREKLSKQPRPTSVASAPKPVAAAPVVRPASGAAPASRPAQPAASSSDGRFVREGASAPRATTAPRAAATPRSASSAAAAGYVVQIAAYSSRARADDLARKLGASVASSSDGSIHRVRFGPFASEAEGQRALSDAQKRGYPQARLYRE
jgi:rare lipoprotein A